MIQNICNTCTSSIICTIKAHNDKLMEKGIIPIIIKCAFNSGNNKDTPIPKAPDRDFSAAGISDLSAKIHEMVGDKDEEAEIKKASPDEYCAICETNNVDLLKCHKCGKWVCQDCSTEDIHGCVTCDNCSIGISMFEL